MSVKRFFTVGYVLILGLASCAGSSQALEKSAFLAARNSYFQAYRVIANASKTYPRDAEVERIFWIRRRDYLLEKGRDLIYNEREQAAIDVFHVVFQIEKDSPVAMGWIMRARLKLAEREVKIGDIMIHEGRLEEAMVHFNKAMTYVPEYPPARAGDKAVKEHYQKRTEKAVEHYKLGSRARGEYPPRYNLSRYHSEIALNMDSSLSRAERLKRSSIRQIAQDRVRAAEKAEEKSFHSAALTEYKAVKLIMPEYEGIDEKIAILEKEVKARKMCRDAEMILRKAEFDRADELLAKAFDEAVSGDVKAIINGVMMSSKQRRYKEAFLKARDLELDWNLEKSLTGYEAIEKVFKNDYPPTHEEYEEGFEGVRARIREVKSTIEEATDAFNKGELAEKDGKLKEAIDHFGESVAVYPGFKDLESRITKLRAQL